MSFVVGPLNHEIHIDKQEHTFRDSTHEQVIQYAHSQLYTPGIRQHLNQCLSRLIMLLFYKLSRLNYTNVYTSTNISMHSV